MSPEKDTKVEILDLAENLLLDRGFNGFSYANISSVLKIKNAAIHYYFPAKADLGVAIIQRTRERFANWTQNQRMAVKPPAEKLEAFFRSYLRFLEAGQQVCLGGPSKQTSRLCHPRCRLKRRNLPLIFWFGWREFLRTDGRKTFFPFRERQGIKPF